MTVSTQASTTTILGNGALNVFSYNFIADSDEDIQVSYTNDSGEKSTLSPSQYTLFRNPVQPGSLHSIGGQVTYPTAGSPIPNGSSITIARVLPLTQPDSIRNQGNFYAAVTEGALDNLALQIQQVSARTGAIRGIWTTNTFYNFGDIVQDGPNGADTGNYYTCIMSNTSGTWAADLAAGFWSESIDVEAIAAAAAAAAAADYALGYSGTSTSNLLIGAGTKVFITQSDKFWTAGQQLQIASNANSSNFMHGAVTSYVGTALTMSITDIGGSGTFNDWNISVSGTQGPIGPPGSGTINSGTANQVGYYATTGTAMSGNPNLTINAGALTVGQTGSVQGSIILSGSSAGTTVISAPATGGGTVTIQAGSQTLVGRATTDTLTNKTIDGDVNTITNIDLTSDVKDILPVTSGGSGVASMTAYSVVCGGATDTDDFQPVAGLGTAGQILTSNGAGALPTFQDPSSANVSYLGVGSYTIASTQSTVVGGATIAGSALTRTSFRWNGGSINREDGTALTGTWRNMCYSLSGGGVAVWTGLFLRTA